MNDPVNTLMAPWAQFGIVGAVVIALAIVVIHLWQKLNTTQSTLLAKVEVNADNMRDLAVKQIDSNNKLANSLDGLETVVKTALDTMQRMK